MTFLDGLDPQELLGAASAAAGWTDVGDEAFLDPLTRYLAAVSAESRLSALGVMAIRDSAVRLLWNRLRFERDWRATPEIGQEIIAAPIVIVGLPRTGTSKLQRLMSTDPGVQSLALWRLLNPAPFPDAAPAAEDPRVGVARQHQEFLTQLCPDLMAAVEWQAEEPEEEFFLMEMTFQSMAQITRSRVPTYAEWLAHQPFRPVYGYLKRLLQYLQWQDGGGRGRPWILKSPTHLGHLEDLVAVFPGVTIVHTHRDLARAIPSLARLLELARGMTSDDVEPFAVGREVVDLFSGEMSKAVSARERLPETAFVDVAYDEIVDDPLRVVRRVFGAHGRALTPEAETCMARWEVDNPPHRFGRHVYSLERFGLTTEGIDSAFASYLERFGSIIQSRSGAR